MTILEVAPALIAIAGLFATGFFLGLVWDRLADPAPSRKKKGKKDA